MRAYFSRRYKLSASHRLHSDQLGEEENREVYGKCNNPYGHGHNYVVEVTIAGPVDDETGMVVNLMDLDMVVDQLVTSRFHLANLNADPLFASLVPTTENLCVAVHALLEPAFQGTARLNRIRIQETENNYFEYPAA